MLPSVACLLLLASTGLLQPAVVVGRRTFFTSCASLALSAPSLARAVSPGAAAEAEAVASAPSLGATDAAVGGDGYTLTVPTGYYRAKGGRAKIADLIFVAADYPAGRTAAVTRTRADQLLLESGDPIALQFGSLAKMKELGKPAFLASLLVRRRDGDPRGEVAQPRSRLISAVAVSESELRFEVRETVFSATSMTSATPASRSVQARALFVPADAATGAAAYLLTAWASSPSSAEQIHCEPTPCDCGEGAALSCECPAPKCTEASAAGGGPPARDPTDVAVVESLRVAPISLSLQQSLKLKVDG